MNTIHRGTTSLLAFVLLIPGLAEAVGLGRLLGQIVDPEGRPIPGVTVLATALEIPSFRVMTTTDLKGVFKVDFDRLNVEYLYRFEKAGFQLTTVNQTWTVEGKKSHKFTMEPGGPPPVADTPPPASLSNAAILAFNAGAAAFEAKDYATAQTQFEAALQLDSNLRQAWTVLSATHVAQKHYQQGAEAAEKAIALGATDDLVLRSRWEAYRGLGDETRATEALAALTTSGQLAVEANRIYNDGVILLKAGDQPGSFAKFQQALEVDPNHRQALLGVATAGVKIDRAAEAFAAAEAILATDPQHEEAIRIRYNAALKLDDDAKIIDALIGLAKVDPVAARDRLFQLANAAFDAQEIVEARKRLDNVLAIDPDHPRSNYILGLIFMRDGANTKARKYIERFLQLAPDDPDAGTAGQILKHLGGS